MKYLGMFICCLALSGQIAFGAEMVDAKLELSVKDAVSMALNRNLELQISRQDFMEAQGAAEAENGAFDPQVEAMVGAEAVRQTGLAAFGFEDEESAAWSASLARTLVTGTEVDLTYEDKRLDSDGQLAEFNPGYGSTVSVGVSQPLLKGGGVQVQTAALRAARKNAEAAENQVESLAADLAASVKTSYWNLLFAGQQIEVYQLSLTLAEKLREDTRRRIEAGVLAAIDIYQPESEVAKRQEALIDGERTRADAEDALKLVINHDDWLSVITPSDMPQVESEVPALTGVIEKALASRADVAAADLLVEAAEISLAKAEDDLRPALDLGGRISMAGADDHYQPIDNLANGSAFSWQMGLTLSLPLGNSAAKGNKLAALANLERARSSARLVRQEVTRSARASVRNLSLALKSIEAAGATALAAKKRLEAEEDKFDVGMVTALDVLEAQEAYANALIGQKRAVADWAIAKAEVQRIQGFL